MCMRSGRDADRDRLSRATVARFVCGAVPSGPHEAPRRVLACLALVTATLAIGCGDPRPPTGPSSAGRAPSPMTSSVTGVVARYESRAPLARASVSYTSDVTGVVAQTITDSAGGYRMAVSGAGSFQVRVDGMFAGTTVIASQSYVGDLWIDTNACRARYGQVTDARTTEPVGGVVVALGGVTAVTDATGQYQLDLGCEPSFNYSTAFLVASHARYEDRQIVIGRGISAVLRLDLTLMPR